MSGGNKILTLVLTCHEKKFINSDGQQYHQYQQNECTYLSPQIINKKKTTYGIGNPGPGLGQAQNGTGLNQLMGIQPIQI